MTRVAGEADAGLWPVETDRVISPDRVAALYRSYLSAFAHLRTEAAARHVLTEDEFAEEMADPRILKYTVWRSAAEPVGLSTVTSELAAVPWISPDFYAKRWPEHAARQAIYYLGIALVTPGRGQYKLLERMISALVAPIAANGGVLAYDVCSFNDRSIQFGRRAEAGLRRAAPVEVSVADSQTYYAAQFG